MGTNSNNSAIFRARDLKNSREKNFQKKYNEEQIESEPTNLDN